MTMPKNAVIAALTLSLITATAAIAQTETPVDIASPIFDAVQSRDYVQCGASTGVAGFSLPDDDGNWIGFDVDFCRALAAAVLGDAEKVRFTPLTSQQRLLALQSGEVDVLSRTTTWTLQRDAGSGLHFTTPTYYDGQGFIVRQELGIDSLAGLEGGTICVSAGTTLERNVADWFRANDLEFDPLVFGSTNEARDAYLNGRCDAYTSDRAAVAATRATLAENPDDHVILDDIISREPLTPAVREDDGRWFDIVRWTVFALVEAENLGIDQANIDEMLESDNPDVQRFLGVSPGNGAALGIAEDWAYQIVKQVGNYSEIFDRNLGAGSPLNLDRGLNALWRDGGLMYPMPLK
jgi:general L-amino acid transport system substrate-binding protein